MNAREWLLQRRETPRTDAVGSAAAKLREDLRLLAADTEKLLAATSGDAGGHLAPLRDRLEDSLRAVKERVAYLQDAAAKSTRAAGQATSEYVRANPWQVAAVIGVASVLIGSVLWQRGRSDT